METLQIKYARLNDWEVITLTGELDSYASSQLRKALLAALNMTEQPRHIIDLSETAFLDSTALAVFVAHLKRIRVKNGELRFLVPEGRILSIFKITGLTKVFEIFPNLESATS